MMLTDHDAEMLVIGFLRVFGHWGLGLSTAEWNDILRALGRDPMEIARQMRELAHAMVKQEQG